MLMLPEGLLKLLCWLPTALGMKPRGREPPLTPHGLLILLSSLGSPQEHLQQHSLIKTHSECEI